MCRHTGKGDSGPRWLPLRHPNPPRRMPMPLIQPATARAVRLSTDQRVCNRCIAPAARHGRPVGARKKMRRRTSAQFLHRPVAGAPGCCARPFGSGVTLTVSRLMLGANCGGFWFVDKTNDPEHACSFSNGIDIGSLEKTRSVVKKLFTTFSASVRRPAGSQGCPAGGGFPARESRALTVCESRRRQAAWEGS